MEKDDYRQGNEGQEGNKDMKYAKYNDIYVTYKETHHFCTLNLEVNNRWMGDLEGSCYL